jgi:hypothetical protein
LQVHLAHFGPPHQFVERHDSRGTDAKQDLEAIPVSAYCRGVHESFVSSEGFDNVLFGAVDQIIPAHFACWRKVRALRKNDKANGREA